jgi:hypothetical protein
MYKECRVMNITQEICGKAGAHSILTYGVTLTLSYGASGLTILNDDLLSRQAAP